MTASAHGVATPAARPSSAIATSPYGTSSLKKRWSMVAGALMKRFGSLLWNT